MGVLLPEDRLVRPFIESSFIASSYFFAIYMLIGVREAVLGERIASRLINQLLGLVTLLSLSSVLIFLNESGPTLWKAALQINLRLLFVGATLLVSGFWLFALPRQLFVAKLVAWSVILWGAQLVAMALFVSWFGESLFYERVTMLAKHLELFYMVLLGMGLLVWLQEDERTTNQALTAKTKYLDTHDYLTGIIS